MTAQNRLPKGSDPRASAILATLKKEYPFLRISGLDVSDGLDHDGDPIMRVRVVLGRALRRGEAGKLVSANRMVRPGLSKFNPDVLLSFTFLTESDARSLRRGAAA